MINGISVLLLLLALFVTYKHINSFFNLCVLVSALLLSQAFNHNILHAQLSLLVTLAFYFYFYFTQKQQYKLAGLSLALTLLKPQLGLPLLCIPLLLKQHKTFLYALASIFLFYLLGYILIGIEGYKDYGLTILQLLKLTNLNHYVPELSEPVYPVQDLMYLFSSRNVCDLNMTTIVKFAATIPQCLGLFGMLYLAHKKITNMTQTDELIYKTAVLALMSMFVFQYHHSHDFNLLFVCTLILLSIRHLRSHSTIVFFAIICSLIPSILVFFMGTANLPYNNHIVLLLSIVALLLYPKTLPISSSKQIA